MTDSHLDSYPPLFGGDGSVRRPPTAEDVRRVAARDVIVHACLAMNRRGELSYEQALQLAVALLSRNSRALVDQFVEQSLRCVCATTWQVTQEEVK